MYVLHTLYCITYTVITAIGGALRFTPNPLLQFRRPRPHLAGVGGCHYPRIVCPPIEMEIRNKNKRKFRGLLNLAIPDFDE